ncbi:MAG: DAK2 domain-containing protein [Coriobacteriales bacterium]|jgi:DAK2 domain fusion protein YloV|nr:DAK2 domain-containing protein [Coriobacteriales bacterium]
MEGTLNAQTVLPYLIQAGAALDARTDDINKLNVFPVPDGDTGTNMSLTFGTVISEVQALDPAAPFCDVCAAITHGSLMGARGNSGVITSQILRGICDALQSVQDASELNTSMIASALASAVDVAFGAVRKPVDGTILTVLRDSASAAASAERDGLSLADALKAVSTEAYASVKRTPELLPVLKENDVVDAGGYGLAILLEGFMLAVTGEAPAVSPAAAFVQGAPKVEIEHINDWEGSKYLYCTEFLFKSEDIDVDKTLKFLSSMGDCELMVGAHPDFKVHVHSNDPGKVLSYMTDRGQVYEVYIHNMKLQSEQRDEKILADSKATGTVMAGAAGAGAASATANTGGATSTGAKGAAAADEPPIGMRPMAEHKPIAVIACASGSGIRDILLSQGADIVVEGGQSMNPSTGDFTHAIELTDSDAVIILPNNKNIHLAANAAAKHAKLPVAVVPTTSVLQAFSALLVFDETASLDDNAAEMTESFADMHVGEVTHAVKRAKASDGTKIKTGDVIGIVDGSIDIVDGDVIDASFKLADMITQDADILTLLAGADMSDADFATLQDRIASANPDIEIDAQRGEQPLYPILMGAE